MKKTGIIIAVVAAVVILWGWLTYNNLVTKQEATKQAWAQVENVCQRRADLVPNLVALVKDYTDYESGTLIAVTEARNKAYAAVVDRDALDEDEIAAFDSAQEALEQSMHKVIAVIENYPDLKASDNYLDLQAQLSGCETRIQTERERFNQAGKKYNESVRKFPSSLIAKLFGFEKWPYFEAIAGAENAPETF